LLKEKGCHFFKTQCIITIIVTEPLSPAVYETLSSNVLVTRVSPFRVTWPFDSR